MKRKDILPTVLEGVAVASTTAVELIDHNNSVRIAELDDWNEGAEDFSISLRRGKTREIAQSVRIPKSATIIYTGKEGAWSDAPITIPEENTVKFRTESAFHTLEYTFRFDNIKEGSLAGKLVDGRPTIDFETEEDIIITVDFIQTRNTKGVERYYFKGFNWFNEGNDDMFLYYGDSFFETPSTEYNPHLMTLAMNLELAACTEESDPTKRSSSIQRLLRNLGCSEVYVNDVYNSFPTVESTDVAVGYKTWNGYNLIFLVLSGAHYSVEFAANVMIGRSGDHTGFALSNQAGIEALRKSIEQFGIKGKTKILIAGYSRTAAGCNLLTRDICDSIAEGTVHEFIGDIDLTQDDVYGLCFETPLCGYYEESPDHPSPTDSRYDNIWYTTNPDDPVTYIPTAKYGFVRYGHRIILNPDHDPALNQAMLANIRAYVSKDAVSFYNMAKFRSIGGFRYVEDINVGFVQKFFDALGTREFYHDVVEKDFVNTVYVGRSNSKVLTDIIKEHGGIAKTILSLHMHKDDYDDFTETFRPSVEKAAARYGYEQYTDNILNSLYQIICLVDRYSGGNVVGFVRDSYLRSMAINATRMVKSHYPAITLSYLMLDDDNYTKPYVEEEPELLDSPSEPALPEANADLS